MMRCARRPDPIRRIGLIPANDTAASASMTSIPIRLGVDIGGTFTDVVLEHGCDLHSVKVLTTYTAPEDAILDGIAQVCARAGVAPGEVSMVIHGTTLATNALIERRGAKTALITT